VGINSDETAWKKNGVFGEKTFFSEKKLCQKMKKKRLFWLYVKVQ